MGLLGPPSLLTTPCVILLLWLAAVVFLAGTVIFLRCGQGLDLPLRTEIRAWLDVCWRRNSWIFAALWIPAVIGVSWVVGLIFLARLAIRWNFTLCTVRSRQDGLADVGASAGIHHTAVLLKLLLTALVEFFRTAEFADRFFGLSAVIPTTLAETIGNFVTKALLTLDGDGIHAASDPTGLESIIPIRINVRRGDHHPVALDVSPHPGGATPATGALVDFEPIKRQGFTDAIRKLPVARTSTDDLAVLDVDVGDVCRVDDERTVPIHRQAMAIQRATEVTNFYEVKPRRADAELDVHRRVPSMATVGQCLGR